jgi:hypothetical protein
VRYANFRLILATILASGVLLSTMGGASAAETSLPLEGRWDAAETADEKQQRLVAIDEVTESLGRLKRGKARSRLAERTSPPSSLMIEIEGSMVTIALGDSRLELELGDSPISAPGSEGKAQVSAKMEGEQLIVVARDDDGERTTTYRADGARLSMEVSMTNVRLTGPLKYVSTYVRAK